MTEAEIVCDAGPLIHLDELSSLDLLADFAAVWIPEPVVLETRRHRPKALDDPPFEARIVASPAHRSDPRLTAVIRAFALDAGEAAALTILVQRDPEPIFLTDDSAARLAAKALRLRSYGTLGVLLRALRRGLRSRAEVLGLLRAIPSQSTLHLGRAVLEDALRQAEAHD